MTSSDPRFSLVITTRNRRQDLLRTLEVMVPRLLPENEILVFDDGSDDGTHDAVAKAFPTVRLLRHDHGIGLMAARNRLHAAARGAVAITLDDDAEIVTPDFLTAIDQHFREHPSCAVTAFRVYWGTDLPAGAQATDDAPRRVQAFVGCGHAWRLRHWRQIRPYPAWLKIYGEESFGAFELQRHGLETHYLPQVLVHHRVVPAERPAAELAWRYRRQLRSGMLINALFVPRADLPRRWVHSVWSQIRRRLLHQRRWRTTIDLAWVCCALLRHLPRTLRLRTPLTTEQWQRWLALAPAEVYWQPPEPNPATPPATPTRDAG